jgi:hypothetical protein
MLQRTARLAMRGMWALTTSATSAHSQAPRELIEGGSRQHSPHFGRLRRLEVLDEVAEKKFSRPLASAGLLQAV